MGARKRGGAVSILTFRRAEKREWGNLAQTFTIAMRQWDTQKADGVTVFERLRGLEASLRAAWPQGRERPWQALCADCDDYGLVMARCPGDVTCGPNPGTSHPRRPHMPHDFGSACHCPKGDRFREKPAPTPDDFTAAGKTTKLQRLGRWNG